MLRSREFYGINGFSKLSYEFERPFPIQYYSTLIGCKIKRICISKNGHKLKITQSNLIILVSFPSAMSAEDALFNDVKTLLARKVLKPFRFSFFLIYK